MATSRDSAITALVTQTPPVADGDLGATNSAILDGVDLGIAS